MSKNIVIVITLFITMLIVLSFIVLHKGNKATFKKTDNIKITKISPSVTPNLNPLSIQAMKQKIYPGSTINIEQTLPDGSNYHQYITSYISDGLKIYALLTVPIGDKPKNGWPVILFNHGYISPEIYQTYPTVGQYATYFPVFSRNGYIVFKPDYRGNGNSEGQPEGAYYSPAYTVDDLNALASIKKYKGLNPSTSSGRFVDTNRIGIWAHSMGGNITLRDLVINTTDIKAAVIWGGVVGSYEDLMYNWQRRVPFRPSTKELSLRNNGRQNLIKQYGTPQTNPTFWHSIDPTYFLQNITSPVQIDVGGSDEEVPVAFSQSFRDKLQAIGKTVEYHEYSGDNHNISLHFSEAMQNSLEFFNKYLK